LLRDYQTTDLTFKLLIPLRSVGGADTSSVMMSWWTLAMLAYPETQARAHAELDAVIGRTRLPTFADYPHLPYIRAMVKELLRWRPIAPIITPHRSTKDDWYEGMFIPKGTICFPNAWHMNRDPEIFGKNTDDFDPARYLDASWGMAPDFKKDGHFSYGFGSRVCVGRHMADNALFINIAILLWAMKIERKKDASGRFLPLDVDGWVDVGLIMLAGFITYHHVGANTRVSADVQSRSMSSLPHGSRTLLRCLDRNVSCGGYECEVISGCT
jgi:cytochrome P450